MAGLRGDGRRLSALALSPDFVRDKTLWVNVVGLGVFKSTDGGQLWSPSSVGLESMGQKEILVSPGFARDQTLFAVGDGWLGGLHRSQDGGQTWQQLSLPSPAEPYLAAISLEFEQDQALLATIFKEQQELYLSKDSGDSRVRLPAGPNKRPWTMLSLAPKFAKWQIAFAWQMAITDEEQGLLYRSDDGGQSWAVVLNAGGPYRHNGWTSHRS